ncbi:MAG: peptidase E, partial [Clostridia bacterium]|nr:peptidase E [Clostridia bacterium]
MDKTIIAVGGGEIKEKTTLKIDEYIASLAKKRAGERRARALFIGTASHDYMPYFNSFRKTYTSVFDIKADVALTVFRPSGYERLKEKFLAADMIYVGGGDTAFMIKSWKESGLDLLVKDAYERGVIVSGLSAGAICWFEKMYTDSEIVSGDGADYKIMDALGYLKGLACPHYDERRADFDEELLKVGGSALAIENDCACL